MKTLHRKISIAPSMLAADFARLGEEARAAESGGADMLHIDVMDGHFVPNITIGPSVVAALRRCVKIPLDVHLMISDPDKFIEAFADAGSDILTVHLETLPHIQRTLQLIRNKGIKAGVSIKPKTPLAAIDGVLDSVALVLIMTVEPGFGGQRFMPSVLPKISELRSVAEKKGYCIDIEVDGGINEQSAAEAAGAGANVIVAGTAVFASGDIAGSISRIRAAAENRFPGKS